MSTTTTLRAQLDSFNLQWKMTLKDVDLVVKWGLMCEH